MSIRSLIALLSNSLKNYSIDDIIYTMSKEINIPVSKLKALHKNFIKKQEIKMTIEKDKKRIWSSVYNVIKETLCPVWCFFCCPVHTPNEDQFDYDYSQGNPLIASNPFVVGNSHNSKFVENWNS